MGGVFFLNRKINFFHFIYIVFCSSIIKIRIYISCKLKLIELIIFDLTQRYPSIFIFFFENVSSIV